jgi:ribulose-phosphate 3-epimerase
LSTIEPLIDFVDSVMLMAINPGVIGHKLLENTFSRISQLKSIIGSEREIKIIVDGGVTFENAKNLIRAGANSIVCGAGTIFKQQDKVFENTVNLRRIVDL